MSNEEHKFEELLSTLKGIESAKPAPHVLTGLRQKIRQSSQTQHDWSKYWAAAAVILFFNLAGHYYYWNEAIVGEEAVVEISNELLNNYQIY